MWATAMRGHSSASMETLHFPPALPISESPAISSHLQPQIADDFARVKKPRSALGRLLMADDHIIRNDE